MDLMDQLPAMLHTQRGHRLHDLATLAAQLERVEQEPYPDRLSYTPTPAVAPRYRVQTVRTYRGHTVVTSRVVILSTQHNPAHDANRVA